MNGQSENLHATCVAIDGTGVLILGPSGSGKSDLALHLIDGGADLVADDRVCLSLRDGAIDAAPDGKLAGYLEVRGVGVLPFPHRPAVTVGLVVELTPAPIDRLPDTPPAEILGRAVPTIQLNPFHGSAAAKVRLAVRALPLDDITGPALADEQATE